MSSNVPINSPFLRTSRAFPKDADQLLVQLNKAYVDTAITINARTIGIFPVNKSIVTGEAWYFSKNQKQQGFRQIYTFTSDGNIPHGIDISKIFGFVRIFGTFTDGTNSYPLPYVDVIAANNQINVIVDSTNIVITSGAGSPPTISSGFVVLEWVSQA